MKNIYELIADDSYAISFQSMGQYRTALLKNRPKNKPRKHKDFEDFLADKFGRTEGASVLDDDWPEAFEEWIQDLDIADVIKWADEYRGIKPRGKA